MDRIYVFILRNDVWMLIVASLGLVWYISEYLRSRRLLKRAVFGLERERGSQLRNNALLFIFALTAVIGGVLYVNLRIAPTLPPDMLRAEPTPDLVRTPLASPTPLPTLPPSPTPPLAPTITLASQPGEPPPSIVVSGTENIDTAVTPEPDGSGTAVALPTPLLPPTPVVGCNLQVTINEPRNGAVINGPIEFFGTANTADFGGYDLEANGPQTNGQWASLLGRTLEQPVVESLLGSVNLSQWAAGPYLIRLTALDSDQNPAYQCVIQITLESS